MLVFRLLVATHNKGKMQEIHALLSDLPIQLVSPQDVGAFLTVEEDGNTYIENATKKAVAYADATGLVSLADDSGLEVGALAGAPGLRSARYIPRADATDADRRAHLLRNLAGRPRPWIARFRAAVAIATPRDGVQWAEGACAGEIIPEERGTGGFGYDRIFLVEGTGRTMAELQMAEKNVLSHRARAIMNARTILAEFTHG
jgi:XTP/dITP diphosphohydrolase